MDWVVNLLVKVLGGFLTAFALYGAILRGSAIATGWFIVLLTVGLTLLALPKIGK